jgi:UDPglucose 6-dehydrogenase
VEKLSNLFPEGMEGKTIGIWGLSFKPQTDDIREAPSIDIVETLVKQGAKVQAYDPQAVNDPFEVHREKFKRVDTSYEAAAGADALIILTEWHEFRRPNFGRVLKALKNPWVLDGRNLFEPDRMAQRGFLYLAIGRTNQPATEMEGVPVRS